MDAIALAHRRVLQTGVATFNARLAEIFATATKEGASIRWSDPVLGEGTKPTFARAYRITLGGRTTCFAYEAPAPKYQTSYRAVACS